MLIFFKQCSNIFKFKQFVRLNKHFSLNYDVVVVGGGHAGCEAAAAAARCGARTVLVTYNKASIGETSCSPSFGGVGKGHLIREIDALDGVCGRICDKSAITYQALNRSKGPSVIGLRAQIDRLLYKKAMQEEILHNTKNLEVIESSVEDIILDSIELNTQDNETCSSITGCILNNGYKINTKCIVITTGTFLNAQMFCGFRRVTGGRIGDHVSNQLADTFRNKLKLKCGRLRTGTPPRLIASTIDFSKFKKLFPDKEPILFSYLTNKVRLDPKDQMSTYIGYSNDKVAELVLASIDDNHNIKQNVTGPRTCPSLEAKVLRFPHLKHRMFLEPEGIDSNIIYPGSFSMSFDSEIQLKILRAVEGFENVEMLRPGYSVHYDFVNPQQLKHNLELKKVNGLFLAGQLNGTTGYEEAGAQGIIAGINAALKAKLKKPFILNRSQGYIGVLIDDLITLGVTEPYRIYTSRVESRLQSRPDNADFRLTKLGYEVEAVSSYRYNKFCQSHKNFLDCKQKLESLKYSFFKWSQLLFLPTIKCKPRVYNGYELLSRFHNLVSLKQLAYHFPDLLNEFADDNQLEHRLKCEGRYSIQKTDLNIDIDFLRNEQNALLLDNLDYWNMNELNLECREKLHIFRPQNIAAASRIEGITSEALIQLLKYVKITQ